MPKSNNNESPVSRIRQNSIPSSGFQSISSAKKQKSHSLDLPRNHSTHSLKDLLSELTKQKRNKDDFENLLTSSPSSNIKSELRSRINDANKLILSIENKIEQFKRQTSTTQDSEFPVIKGRLRSTTTGTAYSAKNGPTPGLLNTTLTSGTFTGTAATKVESVGFMSTSNSNHSDYPIPDISSDVIDDTTESPTWTLSDLSQSLGEKDKDPQFLVAKGNDLIALLTLYPSLKSELNLNTFGHRVQSLLIHNSKEVVASGYRIARHIITDIDSLKSVVGYRIPLFLVISLSKDSSFNVEREQAIKFIRRFIEIEGGCLHLEIGVVKALVAIAEESEDKLRNFAIETLIEISIFNPEIVFKAGGFRVMFSCILDGPYSLSLSCLISLYHTLDSPKARIFLRGGEDMLSLVSAFSDIDLKHHSTVEKLQNTAFLLTAFLKSWVGLISFSSNNFRPIRELVNCLSRDSAQLRDILMDIFFDILRIRNLPWLNSLSLFKKIFSTTTNQYHNQLKNYVSSPDKEYKFINHYTTLLLSVLLNCGILGKLVEIIQKSTDDVNVRKASFLLTEIYTLTSSLLPNDALGDLQKLPSLISNSLQFDELSLKDKFKSLSSNFQIEKVTRSLNKDRNLLGFPCNSNENFRNYAKQVKTKMKYNIDDSDFKKMMNKTKVLTTKEYHTWNWDILSDFINGPLMNPKRLEEVLTTKFIKRIISYYRPFKFRFSSTKKNKVTLKYLKVGCELIKMFLSTSEGVKFLSENKLLPQIAECIAQVDKYSGISAKEPVFSKERLLNTLSSGYFTMLGELSSDLNGLRMLEKWKVFTMFYHIIEKSGRDDLIICILKEMNYNFPSHLRVLFGKALRTCNPSIRVWCTNHLNSLLKISECRDWSANLLIDQLYDPDRQVCTIASKILENYCSHEENLDSIIKCKPSLDHLGLIGLPVLFKFLSTSLGFNYLSELNFVEFEMNEWIDYKNYLYVFEIERILKEENFPFSLRNQNSINNHNNGHIQQQQNQVQQISDDEKKILPMHFFGELVKTEEGMFLLTQSGFFNQLVDDVKDFKFEIENSENILKLKTALWTLGNIGSSELGITLIDEIGITKDIIEIALNHEVWNIKGTAFFVLGLISSTQEGAEILDEMGWISAIDIMNNPLGYCLPKDLNGFLHIKPANPYEIYLLDTSNTESSDTEMYQDSDTELSVESINKKVLKLILKLSVVLPRIGKSAARELLKINKSSKDIFENPNLLYRVVSLVNNGYYKLQTRTFIFELFKNTRVLETIIKRDRRKSRDQKDLEKLEKSFIEK